MLISKFMLVLCAGCIALMVAFYLIVDAERKPRITAQFQTIEEMANSPRLIPTIAYIK